MLASESTVLLVRLVQAGQANGIGTVFTIEKTLQPNYDHVALEPDPPRGEGTAIFPPVIYGMPAAEGFKNGEEYVIFVSYDRSGDCLAAAWAYGGASATLRLMTLGTHFGPDAPRGYQLGSTFLPMPTTISYSEMVSRLYPTGGELDATNAGESWCPGP